jgi:hypothetical protein
MKKPVFWTMKNGQEINVDDMDINHLRNTLKLLIKNQTTLKKRKEPKRKRFPKFWLVGVFTEKKNN